METRTELEVSAGVFVAFARSQILFDCESSTQVYRELPAAAIKLILYSRAKINLYNPSLRNARPSRLNPGNLRGCYELLFTIFAMKYRHVKNSVLRSGSKHSIFTSMIEMK